MDTSEVSGEYLHFRCSWHAVEGHFERSSHVFPKMCTVIGCKNQALAYWYRGAKYQTLPVPTHDIAYG